MKETTYNGWKNYETWNVALWISNEQSSDSYWRDVTQECWDEAEAGNTLTREEQAKYNLADRLRDEITESQPDLGATMWSDLLGAALCEVDWDEIAGNWLEDADKDQETCG